MARSEGTEDLLEGLWAMAAVISTVTATATMIALYVMFYAPDKMYIGPGLLVPSGIGGIVLLSLLGTSPTLIADPGPQADGPDGH